MGINSSPTRLDIPDVEAMVLLYFAKGLAPSTRRTYKAAQDRYLKFCRDGRFKPIPATQSVLCAFVSCLAYNMHHLQIAGGLPDPFAGVAFPQLDQVMKGIKRHEAERAWARGNASRFPLPY